MQTKSDAIKELRKIPGVGKTISNDLWNIGFKFKNMFNNSLLVDNFS